MAGALTANAVTVADSGDVIQIEPTAFATVELLSPVDGANNVLLFAIFNIEEDDTPNEVTIQFYRCGPSSTVAGASLGVAVGPAFTFATGDSEGKTGPFCVGAVDAGAGATSAYAVAATLTDAASILVTDIYVDALLFD